MRPWAASAALALIATATASLTHIGNITHFSDTTCSDPIFVNSWTLGRDFCAIVESSASSPVDVPFRSYILNERPWCDNGSRPYLNVYRDEACAELIRSYEPGALYVPGTLYEPEGPDADRTCVEPGEEYKAMAFVCDGFEGAWGVQEVASVVSSAEGEATGTSSVDIPSSTVVSTSFRSSVTEVTSASPTLSASSEVRTTTATSVTAPATGGTATSPSATISAPASAFTGAGSILGTHVPVAVFGIPLVVLLA